MTSVKAQNEKTALIVISIALSMVVLTFASVPLYDLFCRVTGYGGTPKIVDDESSQIGSRQFDVRFNADIDPHLPWEFKAPQETITLTTGENKLAFFTSENTSDAPVMGTAIYNVTPERAAYYFSKVQCFCFEEQTLQPGEKVEMPVSFYIDPEIENDPDIKNLRTITLSYTFFKAK